MATAILVTGGAGYIGSHACKALARAGYLPVTYDNLRQGYRDAVRWGPLVEGELGDGAGVERAIREHRVAAVMHFAALINVGESMLDPGRYFRNNVADTLTLLEAMVATDVRRLIFSSTCATYGEPVRLPLDESNPQQPVSVYGETKLMVERMIHWFGQGHALRAVMLRYFNAAGADPDGETGERHQPETHLIPLVLQAAAGERAGIDIYGTDYPTPDGTAIRDYIHVQDLADAHVRAARHLIGGGSNLALNLGTGTGHSVREVIDVVERVTGRGVARRELHRRPGDPAVLVADPTRAKRLLGWEPRISDLESIVETAWSYSRVSVPVPAAAVG
jgi:UDP-arabinose 4-epimerase